MVSSARIDTVSFHTGGANLMKVQADQFTGTILVVDDEELIVDFIKLTLKFSRYKVLSALNAKDAMDICRAYDGPVDMALLDISLHGSSGPDLGRSLREMLPGLPIVYMTGFADEDLDRFGVDSTSGLLLKPFVARQVMDKVREVLSAR